MNIRFRWLAGAVLVLWVSFAQAAFHLFALDQLYSNADGSVQFVVLRETAGMNGENFWAGQSLRATPTGGAAQVLPFTTNLPNSATANRRVLVATPEFAALGIVTPDYIMPANFLPTGAGQVRYSGMPSSIDYAALPTDGVNALSISGAIVQNVATNFAGASASVVPAAAPIATVVEFYHSGLDHYFITDRALEIAILDAGLPPSTGWARTTREFNVYTAAGPGTSPVCRIRIPPENGDSHFYGRGTTECNETLQKFPTFVNEDSEFFHVVLPVAGVCPAGTIPVYRVLTPKTRPDANHRYTIERSIRDLMESQQHWQVEGDGDDRVVMCVPPTASAAPAPAPAPVAPPPAPPAPPPMPDPTEPPYYPGYP
jgi:hypothetical protein